MPKRINPQDQWEIDFLVPLPGEPRNIGPLETLFQRLLNRTERLKNRIGAILGLPWDATPPDTLAGLAGRVSTLETNQGGTTLSAHRTAPTLDHPDGSVGLSKLAPAILGQPNGLALLNSIGALASSDAYLNRGVLASAVDWNTLTTAGVYAVYSGAFSDESANTPPTRYQYGMLLVLASGYSSSVVVQIYIPHITDGGIYFRQRFSEWGPWSAAGAEYGANSNGHYIRYADGTQVCWAISAGGGPDPQTVIYPAAFVSPPLVVVTPSDSPPAHISIDSQWGRGVFQQRFRKYNADGTVYSGAHYPFDYIAIGRWK
jgi:hypothetical protein